LLADAGRVVGEYQQGMLKLHQVMSIWSILVNLLVARAGNESATR
jgi:hypothetical protein